MQFQIPQFIERELKVVGPFTLKQFSFIAGGFLGCIGLYTILAEYSFLLFLMLAMLIMCTAFALAFIKINGMPLTTTIANFLIYLLSPKAYLWKRKLVSPKLIRASKQEKKQQEKEKSELKITEKSQLQDLSTKLETGTK